MYTFCTHKVKIKDPGPDVVIRKGKRERKNDIGDKIQAGDHKTNWTIACPGASYEGLFVQLTPAPWGFKSRQRILVRLTSVISLNDTLRLPSIVLTNRSCGRNERMVIEPLTVDAIMNRKGRQVLERIPTKHPRLYGHNLAYRNQT
jgi:hypothetical protein